MMMNTLFKRTTLAVKPAQRSFSTVLHQRMEAVIADRQKEVTTFKKEFGDTVVD